jgi:hypothetical protein
MFGLPTSAEAAVLQFAFGSKPMLATRYAIALPLFTLGAILFASTRSELTQLLGLAAIAGGHAALWVKKQTNAPGGAAPLQRAGVWVPAEGDWHARLVELRARSSRWDITPWDISNALGSVVFVGVTLAALVVVVVGFDASAYALPAFAIVAPIWLNGMRSDWHPNQLEIVAEALARARQAAAVDDDAARYDVVPLLSLVETPRGKYPVDARVMLRPKQQSKFIGIQIQVALNNVRGVNYPYLYCVILVDADAALPNDPDAGQLVVSEGEGEGVRYLVVRQHADDSGGWHTDVDDIARIVQRAMRIANPLLPP